MRSHPLQKTVIYGPVSSVRLGSSLGINLSPRTYKLCSFDCVYCVYGWTDLLTADAESRLGDLPTPAQVEAELRKALKSVGKVDYITFSGSGEPTLHSQFSEIVELVIGVRDELRPRTPLAILSNSSMVKSQPVRTSVEKLDRRIMKLDCGDQETFRSINRPAPQVSYAEILNGLELMDGIEIQTMFLEGEVENMSENSVALWIDRLSKIKPVGVQLCSLHHPPAHQAIRGPGRDKLRAIAEQIEKGLGVPAVAY